MDVFDFTKIGPEFEMDVDFGWTKKLWRGKDGNLKVLLGLVVVVVVNQKGLNRGVGVVRGCGPARRGGGLDGAGPLPEGGRDGL